MFVERRFHGCKSSMEQKFLEHSLLRSQSSRGAKVPWNESSWTFRSPGANVPRELKFSLWTFRSRERKCRGTKSQIPYSNWLEVFNGVLQGSVLGLLLFLLYVQESAVKIGAFKASASSALHQSINQSITPTQLIEVGVIPHECRSLLPTGLV